MIVRNRWFISAIKGIYPAYLFRCAHLLLTLIWAHLGRNKIDVLSFACFHLEPSFPHLLWFGSTWGFPPRLPAGKMGDHGAKQQRLGVGNSTRSAFEVLILMSPKGDSCGIGRSTTKPPSLTLTDRFTWRFSKGIPWLFQGNLGLVKYYSIWSDFTPEGADG